MQESCQANLNKHPLNISHVNLTGEKRIESFRDSTVLFLDGICISWM